MVFGTRRYILISCLLLVSLKYYLTGPWENINNERTVAGCEAKYDHAAILQISNQLKTSMNAYMPGTQVRLQESIKILAQQMGVINVLAAGLSTTSLLIMLHDVGAYTAMWCQDPMELISDAVSAVRSSDSLKLSDSCCAISGLVHSAMWQKMQVDLGQRSVLKLVASCSSIFNEDKFALCYHPIGHGFVYAQYREHTSDRPPGTELVWSFLDSLFQWPQLTVGEVLAAEQNCLNLSLPAIVSGCIDGVYDSGLAWHTKVNQVYATLCARSILPFYCILNVRHHHGNEEWALDTCNTSNAPSFRIGCIAAISYDIFPVQASLPQSMKKWVIGPYMNHEYVNRTDTRRETRAATLTFWCSEFGQLSDAEWRACLFGALLSLADALIAPNESSYALDLCPHLCEASWDAQMCSRLMRDPLLRKGIGYSPSNIYRFVTRETMQGALSLANDSLRPCSNELC